MTEGASWPSAQAAALLQWDAAAFGAGDWWRAWSHVIVHSDMLHLVGNVAAAALLGYFWAQVGLRGKQAAWHALGLWAGYGLLCLGWPGPAWGASGWLHAAAAWAALRPLILPSPLKTGGMRERDFRGFCALLVLALWGKVALEAHLAPEGLAWGLHLSGLICASAAATWLNWRVTWGRPAP